MTKNIQKSMRATLPTPTGIVEVTDGQDWYPLATESFVLNSLNSINGLTPCVAATTEPLNASYDNMNAGTGATLFSRSDGQFVIDGVTPSQYARILVKDQSNQVENGIYVLTNTGDEASSWVLTRASDFDSPSQIVQGDTISVALGIVNAVTAWMQTSNITLVGQTPIVFAKLTTSSINEILGTIGQIEVSVVGGIATLKIADNAVLPGTGSVKIPSGTTAQRPTTLIPGMMRFNTGA